MAVRYSKDSNVSTPYIIRQGVNLSTIIEGNDDLGNCYYSFNTYMLFGQDIRCVSFYRELLRDGTVTNTLDIL